ncbi:hypothetical protein HanRHA438_Chr10g0466681 [Helianthus annuus]|uniref:Transmembrane protein n=1 Tax=Helianthus annuus TaxID=4232 RepID=A0A9K3N517_HELAN|nr:hypothetical protein HanXRQr2_Chr10g0453901 [Helianthus annuus]KAJ0514747.1 hypothetical protein HanHA300_Chr10g0373071 [Helianthus annuus]KAJ0530901.1 hypothetical protein HanHA89_Chr10g0395191 [Helianthus annuus]KAJ0701126.1 hypothetical protein HanOQP8_Chr10g0375961 [Helianthus annuus]KAJ0880748.1 hypothetical protein HanRHA438_Chr10g0466681 [Helianthus annuus]
MTAENANPPLVTNKNQDQMLTPTNSRKQNSVFINYNHVSSFFPIIFCVVWLLYMRRGNCEQVLPLPKLQVGLVVGLLVVFVLSNGALFLKSRFLRLGFVVVMVPLIVILTIGLVLRGAYKIETRMIPGSSAWLKMMVYDDNNWKAIESCIYSTRTCRDLVVQSSMVRAYDFSRSHLSPIEV